MNSGMTVDLSIGQRLVIGFSLVLLVVAVMLGTFLQWHAASAQAQTQYADRIAPLREQVHVLERNIYSVAITLRAALLQPSTDRMQRFSRSVGDARAALQTLGEAAMDPDGRAAFDQVSASASGYLQAAEGLAGRRAAGELDLDDEQQLAMIRETVLSDIGRLSTLQERKAAAALATIASVRERTSGGLVVLGAGVGLILLLLAWLTARSISGPTADLLRTVRALQDGDWKPALALAPPRDRTATRRSRDEMRQLGYAFGGAALALEQREQRIRAEGLVAQAVASGLEREAVSQAALQRIMEHLQVEVGLVYSLAADAKSLVPVASHAVSKDLPPLQWGEGLPGQAALDRRTIVLSDIPADCGLQIKLGYDQTIPRTIAAVPLLFGDRLHGVLVAGSLRHFTADAIAFMERAAAQLGIGLQNVTAHEQTGKLLEEVREYNERIQAQNEELQVQNEEIQAQNEEIQAQSEELQAQNEELTQQGEELRRHAAELGDADERKNTFLGVLAHELRNPMAPISNSIHILKRSAPGSEAALRAQVIIERQAQHLVRLIDDLLDVTRISEGKIHIARERIDLVDMVRVCVEDLAAAFEQAGLRLELDLPETPVEIWGDHTRLCQVLGNLLNNCIKFNDRGALVRLSLHVDAAQGTAAMSVADNGIGMEPELLPRLFEPFSQGISGLARTKGGLGLGLALVKALVHLHDGTVSAHSDGPGRGAVFTVRLPLASVSVPQVPAGGTAVVARAEAAAVAAADQASRRVLIVEDNVDAARTLEEALRMEGYEIVVTHSGQQALDAARTFRPEVVLCDIGLPDMDGHEIARRLRAEPHSATSILIALTGYASPADRQQAASAGFDLHLAKPLQISGLERIIAGLGSAG